MKNKLNHEQIVFIESNTTGTGKLFLEKARIKGLQTIFITKDPNKYSFLAEELIQPIILDTDSEEELYNHLKDLKNLKAVFSTSEYYIESAYKLAKKFGLPANDPKAIGLCRNKDLLAKTLTEHGIKCPKTLIINSIEEINNLLEQIDFDFPVIIKPSKGSGSIGVRLCANKKETFKYASILMEEKNRETRSILIQEYIEGDEYSVETLSFNSQVNIIGITKKYLSEPPFFLETGHDFPINLPEVLNKSIEELILNSFKVLGFLFGPAHTEIRIKNNIPYVIEINPRLAGGMIPEIIKQALGIDLIDETINLVTNQKINLNRTTNDFASIRFIIPKTSGFIKSINLNNDNIKNKLADFQINKKLNDFIILRGDFRDRIGHFIVKEHTLSNCQKLANIAIDSVLLETTENITTEQTNINTGRLKAVLLPEVQLILNHKISVDDKIKELTLLTDIDEAHIIMLLQTNNISATQAKLLLQQIKELKTNNFDNIKTQHAPRGLYLLYEDYMIQKLGIDVAGITHIARSRNDINATMFKLNLRERFFNIYQKLWQLRSTLVNQAKLHLKTSIPIYSQYQTALPGTLAHYLLGIEIALTREQIALQSLYYDLEVCPLGAGAGGGTSIIIDQSITSELLSFSSYAGNSLDAIASRDLVLRILSVLCSSSVLLSRITEDLQLWSTNEFKFVEFPDYLSGGSSMMPQKKNPYLLEKIKGSLLSLIGHYTTSIVTMYKVPFGNSVEIGTESLKPINKAHDEFVMAIDLLNIIIKHIKINEIITKKSQLENLTIATYITDLIVKNKIYSFREAHHKVGEAIRYALDSGVDPVETLLTRFKPITDNLDTDPLNIALKTEYGGGPGINSTNEQYYQAIIRLNEHSAWIKNKKHKITSSCLKRKHKVSEIIGSNVFSIEQQH
jgi:argininosuccinate lyase